MASTGAATVVVVVPSGLVVRRHDLLAGHRRRHFLIGLAGHKAVEAQILPGDERHDHDDEGEREHDEGGLLATGHLRSHLLTVSSLGLGVGHAPLVHHILLLLQRQEGGALVGLHLLGVAHHEDDGDDRRREPENSAERDDDALVDGNADTGERIDGHAHGERVHSRAQNAAAGAQKDDRRAGQAVEAGGHHGGGEQQVEGHRFLAHAVGGAADGEDEHQNGDEHELVALELVHQRGDAGIERAGLGDDTEETAEDHNEQAHADGVLEAEDRRGEHAGERGALDALDAAGGHDNGNDRKRHQDDQQNSERREARALLLFSISHGSFSLRERRPIREIGRRLDRKKA